MPFVQWNDSFLLGVKQFDDHHKHLVELLNKVYDGFVAGASDDAIGVILGELVDYAAYHFAAEEHWMVEESYLEREKHCREHEMFTKKVLDFQREFNSGNLKLTIDVLTFLKYWLTNHILKTDAAYGRYIASKGGTLALAHD